MAKVNFTAARVEAHRCPTGKSQSFIWDARSPGLGLRVTAGGKKSYIFQAKLGSTTIRVTIGDPRSWPIDKAQEEARRLQILVDDGIDPREHAAEQQAAREAKKTDALRMELTVGDAWAAYLDANRARWGERHYQDHLKLASTGGVSRQRGHGLTKAGPLAPLLPLKLPELTGRRIADWLTTESAERATMAALSFRLLRSFIRWAADTPAYAGLIPKDAYRARDVKDAVPRAKAKEGDSLQREQLAAWFQSVRQIGNPVISAYLQALLLTGARREEIAGLRWEDVDFQWRSLHIADKIETETGRMIPLTPYLASLLSTLPRRNEWVFSSPGAANGRLAEPRIAHTTALAAAGLPHVSLHGLRRSFGTLCEWVEMPSGISAQIMGHKPSALAEKHYRRRPLDLLRTWHDRIEAWMLEQADIDFKPEQTPHGLRIVP